MVASDTLVPAATIGGKKSIRTTLVLYVDFLTKFLDRGTRFFVQVCEHLPDGQEVERLLYSENSLACRHWSVTLGGGLG